MNTFVLQFFFIVLLAISSTLLYATPPAPDFPPDITIERDVAYLQPERAEKLDLYYSSHRDVGAKQPAVVLVHGGGWISGDKAAERELNMAATLVPRGYVCASVEYLKQTDQRWPTNLLDCKNAVRFLRANAGKYQIDPDRIAVMGSSAGGHLALMVAYTSGVPELSPSQPYPGVSDKVSACIDLYGITDLFTRREVNKAGAPTGRLKAAGLFPETREQDPEKYKRASPVNYISASTPPTLILQGTSDPLVDQQQSIDLADRLAAAHVEHELLLLPHVGHTFDLQKWNGKPLPQDLRPVVLAFLDKHLRNTPK